MKIRPLRKNLLIELKPEATKIGSIYLPDQKRIRELPLEGKVLDIGSQVEQVKIGDWIHFEPYSLTTVKDQKLTGDYDADKIVILPEEKVVLIVE